MATFPLSYLPDEDEEQRQAEIERLTQGFGTELAAGMAQGGIDVGAMDPAPVDPRAGQLPPIAHGTSNGGGQPLPLMDEDFGGVAPAQPTPEQTARAGGQAPAEHPTPRNPGHLVAGPGGIASAGQGARSISGMGGLPLGPRPDTSPQLQQQITSLDDQERRERRRRGIVAAILSPFMGGAQGVDRFVTQHAGDYQQRREGLASQITGMREERTRAAQSRAEAIARMLRERREQGNAERRFAIDEERNRQLAQYRQDSLAQRGEQFGAREAQDMKQQQLGIEAADTRSRRHANAMTGRDPNSGAILRPGAAPGAGAPAAPDVTQMLDAPIIQALLENRPEILQGARAEAERRRAAGQEADPEAIAWEMATGLFNQLPRDERDRVRRAYITPESTNTAITAPAREGQQMATRVRQYGQDVQGRTEWDRSVRAAQQAMAGATDSDIRMAQQWLQGGMRQAVTELSPGARQLAQRLARLQNVLLRERSGAAVTDQEFARLRSELGANWYQSPDSMRAALQEMGASSQEMARLLAASYGPEVVEAYQQNLRAVDGGGQPAGGTAPPRTVEHNGATYQLVGRTADGRPVYRGPNGQQVVGRRRQ
jgi:hypothetical protein